MAQAGLLKPGDTFGDFIVEKQLGKGGMGAVYLVRAPDGGAFAAKIMVPPKRDVPPDADARTVRQATHEWRKRFAREAEFAMKIEHPNLIAVYDVGEDPESGLCYIIMEYVAGGSLADRLEARGRLEVREACSIAAQIARALDVAHKSGVVHRDLKPDNILFDANGTPKLADLGIAKFSDAEDDKVTSVTSTGMIIGTPAYMSPEQMMDSHSVDARSDIYTLGVVLYEMLTGARPHAESSLVALLAKAIQGEELPDVRTLRRDVSDAVAYVLKQMTAPKREERVQTAEEAARMLDDAAAGRLRVRRSFRARRLEAKRLLQASWLPWIGLAVGVATLVAAVAVVSARRRAPQPAPEPQTQIVTNIVERVYVVTNEVARVPAAVPDESTRGLHEVEPQPKPLVTLPHERAPEPEAETIIPEPEQAPETVAEAPREVAPRVEQTPPPEAKPATDPTIRKARVGAQLWYYSLEEGFAVLRPSGPAKCCLSPIGKSDLEVPETLGGYTVAIIGEDAFGRGAGMIRTITLPATLREIRDRALGGTRLRKIVLPASVEKVGRGAFPETLKEADIARAEIAYDTFSPGTPDSLTVAADSPAHRLTGGVLYDKDAKKLLFALKSVKDVSILGGVEEVCAGAFRACKQLKRVMFPASLAKLGAQAFAQSAVKEVVFEGDAPVCAGRPFQDARKDLTINVNVGSTGWQKAGSTRLPPRWPVGDDKDARLIFYR